jgi:hypothetical protein
VAPDTELNEFSALLTWNREVDTGTLGWLTPTSSLANLDLELRSVTGTRTLGQVLDLSQSTVDNVEHLYFDTALTAGRYALSVVSADVGTDFALAWYGETLVIPEPSGFLLLGWGAAWIAGRRRRAAFPALVAGSDSWHLKRRIELP